jgi:hypothetical protein
MSQGKEQAIVLKYKLCGFVTFKLFLRYAIFQFTYAPIHESTGCVGISQSISTGI